jgi:hypothetical protein
MLLKLMELRVHFRFMFQEENPCEFRIIIYKTHIKFILQPKLEHVPTHLKAQAKEELLTC